VSAAVQGGDLFPQVALVAATAAVYAIGRILGNGHYVVLVAAAIAVGILVAAIASGPHALMSDPFVPPLGYANANGALYGQGVAAAAIVATAAQRTLTKGLFGVLALVLLGLTVASGSLAAAVLAAGILVAALAARRLGYRFVLFAPLLAVAGVVITVVVGMTHDAPAVPVLERALTERRAVLWQEALTMFAAQPVFGIGPGMFAVTSPTALANPDAQWAHSAHLQIAAEIGLLGVLLFIAVFLWAYAGLYRSRQDLVVVVIGTAAATAFTVQATMDYLLHFPALVLIVALLVGLASSRMSSTSDSDTPATGDGT
jgi:O-antigen ligase